MRRLQELSHSTQLAWGRAGVSRIEEDKSKQPGSRKGTTGEDDEEHDEEHDEGGDEGNMGRACRHGFAWTCREAAINAESVILRVTDRDGDAVTESFKLAGLYDARCKRYLAPVALAANQG
jgi:hypothetical protein